NYFKDVIGDSAEIISVKSDFAIIEENNFVDCQGGITLRLSNSSTISNNSFNNTSHSLRIFGAKHKIINNYIENSVVGIQLPSADKHYTSNKTGAVYRQAYDILINGNVILNSRYSIMIGNGYNNKRNFLPYKITIKDNKFNSKSW